MFLLKTLNKSFWRYAISKKYSCGNKSKLKEVLKPLIEKEREKIKAFRQKHGKETIGEIKVDMVYGGMRGITGLIWETSLLDPQEGIRFRGLSIPDCQEKLPKAPNCSQILPESIFWLLMTGNIPTEEEAFSISNEWAERSELPKHVIKFLKNVPKSVHPMTQFSCAINLLQNESEFKAGYEKGMKKSEYWEYAYEDVMNLMAKLTPIGALIYNRTFKDKTSLCPIENDKDWSYNFANMMNFSNKEFVMLLRMYLSIHTDHEGGNVSAHATKLVGSALSDPYISMSAGMNGLAGPLHGRANQEVLEWLIQLREKLGDEPTKDQLKDFCWETLKSGRVIPGYGHAVLRKTDPRYICQREFALKFLPNDPLFLIVSNLYEIVPDILKELGKVQNPWPNVDAHSGVLLQHYGLTETNFYTVLFGISRGIGVLTGYLWDRALGAPLERPKSITTEALMKKFNYTP